MKRKGVDQVSDDFSDFSLASPATKIRRLDVELPPIVKQEEPLPEVEPSNQERALVLFTPLLHSPSSFSLTLHSDFVSGIKNQNLWSKQCDSDCDRIIRSAEEEQEDKNNHRLALVPWVPSQFPPASPHDLMEAEEMEGEASSMMDIEQDTSNSSTIHSTTPHGGITAPEGFHQWQQQHCFLPQLPQNTSTPITWTR